MQKIEKQLKNLATAKENRIETKLIRAVRSKKGVCMKFVSPGQRGVPDRLCFFPGGKFWLVETKRPGKKPDPLQLIMHELFRKLGFEVRVISNEEQLKQFENEISGA